MAGIRTGRLLAAVLAAALAVSMTPGTVLAEETADGGTSVDNAEEASGETVMTAYGSYQTPEVGADGYYILSTADDLSWFEEEVEGGDSAACARLAADITMPDSFDGIGTEAYPYAGSFDGDGYTVAVSISTGSTAGLFARVSGAVIEDVIVEGSVYTSSGSSGAAGLVAYAGDGGVTVSGCENRASIRGSYYIGGIVGCSEGGLSVSDCANTGRITILGNGRYVGGIVGRMNGASEISGCTNEGRISGAYNFAGGIAGYAGGSTSVSDCANAGDVSGSFGNVGGVVGYAVDSASVSDCTNDGAVSGGGSGVGGIAGGAWDSVSVSGCTNDGTVSGDSSSVGGVVGGTGDSVSVSGCTNAGEVSGKNNTGGIVGRAVADSSNGSATGVAVEDCVNRGDVSVTDSYVGGVVGELSNTNTEGSVLTVRRCGNEGDVTSDGNRAGGVAGINYCGSSSAKNVLESVYNAGSVSGTTDVGGIVGSGYGSISMAYNVGDVSGTGSSVGGILGRNYNTSAEEPTVLSACYNAGAVTWLSDGVYVDGGALAGYLGGSTYALYIENSYYLNTLDSAVVYGSAYLFDSATGEALSETGLSAMIKTSAELIALADVLGDEYRENLHSGYHLGYPVLEWESDTGHVLEEREAVEPTCAAGHTVGLWCVDCGAWVTGESIPAVDEHVWGTVTSRMTAGGVILTYTCTVCGETYEETAETPAQDEDGVYLLSDQGDILWLAAQTAAGNTDCDARLADDITMDTGFSGIGIASYPYAGNFDGDGYTVTLDISTDSAAGLFAFVSGAEIQNVTVEGSVYTSSASYGAAGLVGYAGAGGVTVTDCVNGASVEGSACVGGIVGRALGTLTVSGSSNGGDGCRIILLYRRDRRSVL